MPNTALADEYSLFVNSISSLSFANIDYFYIGDDERSTIAWAINQIERQTCVRFINITDDECAQGMVEHGVVFVPVESR